ncbi:OLC1v1034970C1 [Oldenlandia corymbosa var. corymbosa]|uniref:Copper transport protein n=1 Tax=Oldenlandia corymbosa var. corymbosa TaxID=529605 RepID=A0AAV1CSL1_OLDCO|nr:OLC1v1034970C1 [Oldenlandia corymbosa var. corymbosa]
MGITPPLPIRHHHNITAAAPPPPPPPPPDGHHKSFSSLMHFYWGTHAEILFSGWPGNSKGMYGLALVFVFFLAVFVEMFSNINLVKPESKRAGPVVLQTVVHGIRSGLAFMVMLSVMSYNGGVFIAAVLGHAVGYVIFGSPVFKKGSSNS